MTIKQLTNASSSIETSVKSPTLAQLLTIGGLAVGASVGIAAAPAHAVALNNGALTFTGSTSDFFANAGNSSFSVNFSNNPPPTADVNSATGDFATSGFPTTGSYGISSPTVTFTQVGATNNYTLNTDLIFAFANGTNVTVGQNSQFARTFNGSSSVSFGANGTVGTTVSNSSGTVNTDSFNLTFNDISSRSGAGGYSVLASTFTAPPRTTAVPEPFTIVGTIVGGTAALRMRKKLAKANQN